jgi:hypothetical protein
LVLIVRGFAPMRNGIILTAGLFFLYIGPGVIYLVTAIYLKRRRFWAVIVGLVLASVHLLFVLIVIAGLLITMSRHPAASVALIPMILMIFVGLALAQLIYHLSLSFEAIKYAPVEDQHGFEPLMGQAVEPPPAPRANPTD